MNGPSTYRPLFARPWVYHVLFWLAYYFFACFIALGIHRIYSFPFYAILLILVPPDILLVYGNLYLLVPKLLVRRRFALYLTALAAWLSLLAALGVLMHHVYAAAGVTVLKPSGEFTSVNFFVQLLNGMYLVGLTTGLKFLKDWMIQNQQLQEKERQRVTTELNFLKSQVHPHFFFNTLNNLYSLTLDKDDRAPEVVQKLAELMSYLLYESSAPSVALQKEISNLENYLLLERLRFGERLSLSFQKEGDIQSVQVPPLILLTFVENGFKHGVNYTAGEGKVTILLQVKPDHLFFEVTNPVEEPPAGEVNGLGLKNVIRRLDLLYGDRYQLDLAATDTLFRATLKMPLS